MVRTVGLPELATDHRFATGPQRARHDEALASALSARFAEKPAAEWESMLTDADVGCVEANLQGQPIVTSFDPVLRDSGLTVAFDHPLFGEMVRAAPPVMFSETPGRVGLPCARGEHNRSILREHGFGDDEITRLEGEGIVIPPD